MSENNLTAPVGALQKFSTEDGPGIRTTVFLKGCPLRCRWCHNPELIDFDQQIIRLPRRCISCGCCIEACPKDAVSFGDKGQIEIDRAKCDLCMRCTEVCYAEALKPVAEEMTVDEVMDYVAQDKGFYDNTGGGMTISGGEMLSRPEFVRALVDEAEARGIGVCLDTSGFGDGDVLAELAARDGVTDILFDIKSMDDDIHMEYVGVSNTAILDNLKRLTADPVARGKIMMRMPLISGVNDSDDNIEAAGKLYRELGLKKVTLLPYHSLGVSKERNIGRTPEEFHPPTSDKMDEIRGRFEALGMEVQVLGQA